MKTFQSISMKREDILSELNDLKILLQDNDSLKEREQVLPFFESRKNLTAAIGMVNGLVADADKYAHELGLFGDFRCDAASGDSEAHAYTLIEFEPATPTSIFKSSKTETNKYWSSNFEHGYSQLVDWAWSLHLEGNSGVRYRKIFEKDSAHITLLMIIGRSSFLTPDEKARLVWRGSESKISGCNIAIWTYDDIVKNIERRLKYKE